MACDRSQDWLSTAAAETIGTKTDVLPTSLLDDELNKKVYIYRSIIFSVMVFEPHYVVMKIEVGDWVDIRA